MGACVFASAHRNGVAAIMAAAVHVRAKYTKKERKWKERMEWIHKRTRTHACVYTISCTDSTQEGRKEDGGLSVVVFRRYL